jgi:hypothetical protein
VSRHRQPDEGQQLLGLAEIGVRGIDERLALQGHDALVAIHVAARIDGHRDMPAAEQRTLVPTSFGIGQCRVCLVEAGVAAHLAGRLVVRDEKIQCAVGFGLQDELAVHLERRTEHGGQRQGFAQRVTDRLRVGMPRQDGIDHRAQPDDTAPDARAYRLEGQQQVVGRHGQLPVFCYRHQSTPRHQAKIAFCACKRFSASSTPPNEGRRSPRPSPRGRDRPAGNA